MGSVVEINPLTRLEGHGSVKVFLDGARVERVELHLSESPRLFEALLVGKSYAEVPDIVCRICSLCSTVHKVTALLAVEDALGIEVSELTSLTRELMLHGATVQDHALHLYFLVLPDLLGVQGVAELALAAPELVKQGLAVKKVGSLIQETVGGRLIHPVNIRLGGLGRVIPKTELMRLREELRQALPACRDVCKLFGTPFPFPKLHEPAFLALEPSSSPLASRRVSLSGDRSFAVREYRGSVTETIVAHSNAKLSKVMGVEATVGALARLHHGPTLSEGAREIFRAHRHELIGKDIRGNNLAQAIELCDAAERALHLVERLLEPGSGPEAGVSAAPCCGTGTAACEAPRGVLIHSYTFDDAGICTQADVVTPTALNQGAMARDLLALARGMEGEETTRMAAALERLIRCYDPCISCSVHTFSL